MRVFRLDGMQRMFRQTDQIDRQNGWLVGIVCALYLRGKEKKKIHKVFAVDRSIDISHSHPEREGLPVPPPPTPITHPIQSDPIIPPRYLSIGWRKLHVHSFFPMHASGCLY